MWLKLIGSLMVIGAGTCTGFSIASRYSERPRQITQLIGCLAALKSCVNYISMPLPEALIQSASGVEGPVKELFCRTGEYLANNGWVTPCQALETILEQMGERLAFCQAERDILLQLGANLGITGREEQQKYLTMVVEELGKIEIESRLARDRNVKMFRYLGICAGLVVVILLI